MDLSPLSDRGIVVAAMNNVAANIVRPQLWFCVDTPANFHESIWLDPGIQKFVKSDKVSDHLRTMRDGKWVRTALPASMCPNVWPVKMVDTFDPRNFLISHRVPWGSAGVFPNGQKRHTRSVMLVALRMLFWLGFRRVYLLGCDFWMRPEDGQTYAFDQQKTSDGCGYNNNSYLILNGWFREMVPHFAEYGYHVYNCTPESRLDAFPRREFSEVVEKISGDYPQATTLGGMYG